MSYILASDLREKRVRLIDPQGNVEHAEDNVWAHMQFADAEQVRAPAAAVCMQLGLRVLCITDVTAHGSLMKS